MLASACLLAAEAPAAWPGLGELLSSGSRSSSRSRQSGAKRRQTAHAESENPKGYAAVTNDTQADETPAAPADPGAETSSAGGLSMIAEEAIPDANAAAPVVTNTVTHTVTNTVIQVLTNTVLHAHTHVLTNVVTRTVTNVVTQADTGKAACKSARGAAPKRDPGPPRISSSKVYYDRKEGYAVFSGKVHVDSEDYQLHANKAYVFFEGTNELKRIVATGGVAITNDTKRAYGAKASYYRASGMVVLYGDDKVAAEVRDESKDDDQVVRGSKIKFWTTSEQVEVVDASITSPVSGGMDSIKAGLTGQK